MMCFECWGEMQKDFAKKCEICKEEFCSETCLKKHLKQVEIEDESLRS